MFLLYWLPIGSMLTFYKNSDSMTRKLLFFILLGSLPFLSSCDRLKGDVGPEGPQGEQGPQGVKGDPGEGGAGALQFSEDAVSTDEDGTLGIGFTLNRDNAAAVEKGVILVYAKSGGFWFPLPGLVFFGDEVTNYTFLYQVENLELNVVLLETVEAPKVRTFQSVRVVIVQAANARLSAEAVDYKDYEAVRKAFDLPE